MSLDILAHCELKKKQQNFAHGTESIHWTELLAQYSLASLATLAFLETLSHTF